MSIRTRSNAGVPDSESKNPWWANRVVREACLSKVIWFAPLVPPVKPSAINTFAVVAAISSLEWLLMTTDAKPGELVSLVVLQPQSKMLIIGQMSAMIVEPTEANRDPRGR